MRVGTLLLLVMMSFATATTASPLAGDQEATAARARLQENLQIGKAAAASFNQQAAKAAPSDGSDQQKRGYAEQTEFLRGAALRLLDFSERASAIMRKSKASVAQVSAMNQQFLALQLALRNESRKFATLSNASKARHDVAMNSIRNIRA